MRILQGVALSAMLVVGLALGIGDAKAQDGDFMIRILGAGVLPDASADVSLNGVQIPGADADISDAYIPAATLTYFMNRNLAVELFCCVAQHDVDGAGTINAVGSLGETWIFPPTVTLQYHFDDMGGFKPYVGAGVTYIHFFDEKNGRGAANVIGATSFDLDDAFGVALQAGVDVSLGGNWYATADVKKIFVSTDATWQAGVNRVTADVDIDPWIVSFGLGYRFDLFGSPSYTAMK